jgi:DUF4097 and DUF4098 domain-containing protein YvlB
MRFRFVFALALVMAALPLLAQDQAYVRRGDITRQGKVWVEEAECGASVRPGGRLVLRADLGSVMVVTGRDDSMRCRVHLRAYASDEQAARRLFRGYELSIQVLPDSGVSLRGRAAGLPAHLRVDYEVQVPRRFNLELETRGGHLQVQNLEGSLKAVTAGGEIRAGDVSGAVRAETAGGSIVLGNAGQRVEARTAGGNIRVGDVAGDAVLETSGGEVVAGRIAGSGRAITAGGDVVLRGAGSDLVVQTAGGQIHIGEAGASVRAQTAGGSIQVDAVRGPVEVETAGGCIYLDRVDSAVQAATVAGTIRAQITANRDSFGASLLQTLFGDVEVFLPPDLPLTIEATIQNATGHKILSDFPLEIKNGKVGFRAGTVQGHGALNGGGVTLKLRTTAGNIQIRKLDLRQLEKLEEKKQRIWQKLLEYHEEHRHEQEKP